jgi:hypothetical protein
MGSAQPAFSIPHPLRKAARGLSSAALSFFFTKTMQKERKKRQIQQFELYNHGAKLYNRVGVYLRQVSFCTANAPDPCVYFYEK